MLTQEFSNEFEILYNNTMSNAAPGLNEYEKSVFLTKAQNEIIFNYFNPNGNKYKEGFDDSSKRQMDFSELIKSNTIAVGANTTASGTIGGIFFQARESGSAGNSITITVVVGTLNVSVVGTTITLTCTDVTPINTIRDALYADLAARYLLDTDITTMISGVMGDSANLTGGGGSNQNPFDLRGQIFVLPNDVLLILNEVFINGTTHYRVVPIDFREYDRLMSKPFKEPLKSQVWRLIKDGATAGIPNVEIIPHSGTLTTPTYSVRYIKRPQPIILVNLTSVYNGLTIDSLSALTECELNPIVHRQILDRAVELAIAAYTGEIKNIVELNNRNE